MFDTITYICNGQYRIQGYFLMSDTKSEKKSLGRPRQFDRDKALDQATQVFCQYGYEGTAVSKLTKAMGINSPSLYAAFGDKERLFLQVLDKYHQPFRDFLKDTLFDDETAYGSFEKLFTLLIDQYKLPENADGCLVVNSTIDNQDGNKVIAEKIKSLHKQTEDIYFERLEIGQDKGDVSKDTDIRALARYIHGVMQGASVLIRGRQSSESVEDMLSVALQSLKGMLGK